MKSALLTFLFSPSIDLVGTIVFFAIGVVACGIYYRMHDERRKTRSYLGLAIIAIAIRIVFAMVKTGLQYYAWTQSELSRFFLPPYRSISYLLQYSWTHFWLNALLSVGAALLFFGILRALQAHNPRYFDAGEVELGALIALVVGWPHVIVFVPVVFLLVVIISIIRGVVLHKPYTTLGLPFFLGAVIAFALTTYIIATFHLTGVLI